jgi:hypothetical protein
MKVTLTQYFKSRTDIDVTEILSLLSLNKEQRKSGMLGEHVIRSLLCEIRTLDDIVAASTIIRHFADRKDRKLFAEVAHQLELASISCSPPSKSTSIESVTLLSAVTDGPHLKLIYAYAAALLVQPSIKKINIVFTGEWEWGLWSAGKNNNIVPKLLALFAEQTSHFPSMVPVLADIGKKLGITLAPRAVDMQELLGNVVIRFEGLAAFKTTYIFGKKIHEKIPVVTATFSSHITSAKNSDITLVRAKATHPNQIHFTPPATVSTPLIPPAMNSKNDELIVTVYSQERIKSGLAAMCEKEWQAIETLFLRKPNAKWLLVGAYDPIAARTVIPSHIKENFGNNIELLAFSNLDDIYRKAHVFLAFQNMFGGGGAASMAISYGVPVLVKTDQKSDIANLIPEEFHVRDFVHALKLTENWLDNPGERYQFIKRQQESFSERLDIESKGRELLGILTQALCTKKASN